MEHNEQKQNMRDSILDKINARELRMHPRYYFYLRMGALAFVSIAIMLITVFICNFLLFSIRINSQDQFLAFGPRGWGAFLAFFPWDLFGLDVLFVAALLWLLRQFKFGYKSPMLYIVLLVVMVTIAAGVAIDRTTGINEHFLREADEQHLPPPINGFYFSAHRMPPPGQGVCRCQIISINGNTLMVSDLRDASTSFTVMLPPNDPRATTSGLEAGNVVFIAGDREGGDVQAFGVRKIYINDMK